MLLLGAILNIFFVQAWSNHAAQNSEAIGWVMALENPSVSDYDKKEAIINLFAIHRLSTDVLGRLVNIFVAGPGTSNSSQQDRWRRILKLIKTNLLLKKNQVDESLEHASQHTHVSSEILNFRNHVLNPLARYLESEAFWQLSLDSGENTQVASQLCVLLRIYEDSVLIGITRQVRTVVHQQDYRELILFNLSELLSMRRLKDLSGPLLPDEVVFNMSQMAVDLQLTRSLREGALRVLGFVLKDHVDPQLETLERVLESLIGERENFGFWLESVLFDYFKSSRLPSKKIEMIQSLLGRYMSPDRSSKYRAFVAKLMFILIDQDLAALSLDEQIRLLALSFDAVDTYCFWVETSLDGSENFFDVFSILDSWSTSLRLLSHSSDYQEDRRKLKNILSHMDLIFRAMRLQNGESLVKYVSPADLVLTELIEEESCDQNLKKGDSR